MPMKGTGYVRLRPWTQRRARVDQVARETVTMVVPRVAQVRRVTWGDGGLSCAIVGQASINCAGARAVP